MGANNFGGVDSLETQDLFSPSLGLMMFPLFNLIENKNCKIKLILLIYSMHLV